MKRFILIIAALAVLCILLSGYRVSAQAEQWYAAYRTATGELVSTGTKVGDGLKDITVIMLPGPPDWKIEEWDTVTKSFKAKAAAPAPPTVDDLKTKEPKEWTSADIATALQELLKR